MGDKRYHIEKDRLLKCIANNGLTQKKLADYVGIHSTVLNRLINGGELPESILRTICVGLNCDVNYITGDIDINYGNYDKYDLDVNHEGHEHAPDYNAGNTYGTITVVRKPDDTEYITVSGCSIDEVVATISRYLAREKKESKWIIRRK